MITPVFPPSPMSKIIYVSVKGGEFSDGTKSKPVNMKGALDRIRKYSDSAVPIYVLFNRGEFWEAAKGFYFYIGQNLIGNKNAPIIFSAYGEGLDPRFDLLQTEANLEYIHFQNLKFNNVKIHGNKYHAGDEYYPETKVKKLILDKRFKVQRLRFFQCEFESGSLSFKNHYTNAGRGSRIPLSNSWWGGGPLAGMIRDIEISHSSFLNTDRGSTPDAINFSAVDRGVWIHHNTFINTKEEHLDISGGYGHIVEHNLGIGSVTNNGIKLHSQFSLLTNSIVRHNTVLYSGGWDYKLVGARGNAFVALNTMGCYVHNNNFISRWSASYGDDTRIDDRAYYGTFTGNVIENNIYGGGVQITGIYEDAGVTITSRNAFMNNHYRAWPDDNKLIRFWNKKIQGKLVVGKNISAENFKYWTAMSVQNERVFKDLSEYFIQPFEPISPNTPLNIHNYGNWQRKSNAQ